jgi:hypothetical protein
VPMEVAHNVVHYYVGGVGGDLYYIDLSPNDPLFFLHHVNIGKGPSSLISRSFSSLCIVLTGHPYL